MSQTAAGPQCSVPSPAFDRNNYQFIARRAQTDLIIISLLAALYGVLAALSVKAVYDLIQCTTQRTRLRRIILSLAPLVVFASATVHMVAGFLYYQSRYLLDVLWSGFGLWLNGVPINIQDEPILVLSTASDLQSCTRISTLGLNVILADAIVFWQVCVIWRKASVIRTILGAVLLATFVLEIIGAVQSCRHMDSISASSPFVDPTRAVLPSHTSPIPASPIVIATSVLSLTINILGVLLVGYKIRRSRGCIEGRPVGKENRSGSEGQPPISVKFGTVYCGIWAVVVAFQVCEYSRTTASSPTAIVGRGFLNVVGVLVNSAFVPATAIYSMCLISMVTPPDWPHGSELAERRESMRTTTQLRGWDEYHDRDGLL